MRISDWSSDVCSSDLQPVAANTHARAVHATHALRVGSLHHAHQLATHARLLLAVIVVDVVRAVCAGACDHARVVPTSPAIPSFHLRALAQQPLAANTHTRTVHTTSALPKGNLHNA